MYWNTITENYLSKVTKNIKRKRVELFISKLSLGPNDLILDLGSEDGSYLGKYYPYPQNIILADIVEEPMRIGVDRYNLGGYAVIPENGELPFSDSEFDAVWCNSVIEHVIGEKNSYNSISDLECKMNARKYQKKFAIEIERVGAKYFVQTPYIHFPIEAHSWLPVIQYLPHNIAGKISTLLKRIWVKQWSNNFYLYDFSRAYEDFPNANEFYFEKLAFLKKSIIVMRK